METQSHVIYGAPD